MELFNPEETIGKYDIGCGLYILLEKSNNEQLSNELIDKIKVDLKCIKDRILSIVNKEIDDTLTIPLSMSESLIIDIHDGKIQMAIRDDDEMTLSQAIDKRLINIIDRREADIINRSFSQYTLNKTLDSEKTSKIIFTIMHRNQEQPNITRGAPEDKSNEHKTNKIMKYRIDDNMSL